MSKLNDLDNADDGVPFPPSRLLLHDHVQMYYSFCRASPEDVLSCVTGTPRPLVLLLAPGDTRSLLYTLYRNFDPEFRGRFEGADFLVNDNWSLLQARDILMLHLCLQLPHKVETEEGRLLCAAIWAIFFSCTLRPAHVRVLKDAVTALSQFGTSLEAWASPQNPLGKIVKFRNEETFRAIVKQWVRWSEDKPAQVPSLEIQQEFRLSFVTTNHTIPVADIMTTYTEQCVTYLLGLCADSVPMKTQRRMHDEFSVFLQTGVTFAEDMLQLPVENRKTVPNVTIYDGTSHTIIHNPFYTRVPFLGFFHSFLFSPSGCRQGNVPRSLCDKLPVADEEVECRPLLANSIQQLILWLSASSRALRKLTVQASPCVTFTFECGDPVSLCLNIQRNPELYSSCLGAKPLFDVIHTFEAADGISPPDLILQAVSLLKQDRFLIAQTVDYRSVGPCPENYLGSLFGLHPQIFPVMFGCRCLCVDGSFADCTVVRHSAWNQAKRRKSYDVHTLVFQRVLSTPYVVDNVGDVEFAPRALVSCIHGATYNFPVNPYARMMSMETVVGVILAFVSQMEENVAVHKWQFWDEYVRRIKEEAKLECFRSHLQTVAMLHGLHFHVTVTERDCPICRCRPLSSYLSLFSLKIKDPEMIPHTTIGLFVHKESRKVEDFLGSPRKETHTVHAVALRKDEDGQFFVQFYFPKFFADTGYKLTLVKFSEKDLVGQVVQVPDMLYQGPLEDSMVEGSRYFFKQLPKRRASISSSFGEMQSHVAGCEKVESILDIPANLVYRLDCSTLMVDSNKVTHMHLCLQVNEYCKYDIYYPYPVIFTEMKIEFHVKEDTVTITAPRDHYSFHTRSPLFVVTPTNRLFLPAAPLNPAPTRDYLALQMSPMEEETLTRPSKWVPPIIRLKYTLRDLFQLASSRCRFVHIHTTKEGAKPKLQGMLVIHDEVVDLDTRSPAIDLSFCFLKDWEDKPDLIAAWSKMSADHNARSLSLPHANLEYVTQLFDYYASRTHTVYTDNNHTSLCRIKVLRKNGIEGFFTRAVVFPMYASPDQQIEETSSDNKVEQPAFRRVPQFVAGVFSHGGVPVNEDVKKVIEALSPPNRNSEEGSSSSSSISSISRGAAQVSLTTQANESDIINTLFEAFRDAQTCSGNSLFNMFAGLSSGVTMGPPREERKPQPKTGYMAQEAGVNKTEKEMPAAAAKPMPPTAKPMPPTPKPRESKESKEKLKDKMKEKVRERTKETVGVASVSSSPSGEGDEVKKEVKPLKKEETKPVKKVELPKREATRKEETKSSTKEKPVTKAAKPLMKDEVVKRWERKVSPANHVKPPVPERQLKPPKTPPQSEEKGSGREERGRKTSSDTVNGAQENDSAGGKPKHKVNGREGVRSKGRCANCGKSSSHMKKCAGCGRPRYCSRECQKQHWKIHKPDCLEEDRTGEREGKRDKEEPGTIARPPLPPRPPPRPQPTAAVASPVMLTCTTCGRRSAYLKRCRCVQAFYCDIECQRKDWLRHKITCSAAPGRR